MTATYKFPPQEDVHFDLSVAGVIEGIQAGTPLYPLLQLDRAYDVRHLGWKFMSCSH